MASVATDADGKISVTAQNIGRGVDGNVITLVPADATGAALMVNNDRILGQNATMQIGLREG
mgnify:CR=1 FL=1